MTNLRDLNNTGGTSPLEALKIEADTGPAGNEQSNSSMAAHITVLGKGEDPIGDYRSSFESLEGGDGLKDNPIVSDNRAMQEASYRDQFINLLADESLTLDGKKAISSSYLDAVSNATMVPYMVNERSLQEPMLNESPEIDRVRVNTGAILDSVHQYNNDVQKLLNAELTKVDPTVMQTVGSLAEIMVPMMEESVVARVENRLREELGDEFLGSGIGAFVLMGSSKEDIRDALLAIPAHQRMEAAQLVADTISESSGIVLTDDNSFAHAEMLNSILKEGYYNDWGALTDNLISLLDTVGVGFIAKGAAKSVKLSKGVSKAERAGIDPAVAALDPNASHAREIAIRDGAKPASVSRKYNDTNPEKARNLHEAMASDETGEIASATYGASRESAVAVDIAPEIARVDGSVTAKTHDIDAAATHTATYADDNVVDFVHNWDGANYYAKAEKINMRSVAVNRFDEAFGIRSRGEMNQVREYKATDLPDGVEIRAVYGPKDTGFSNAKEALEYSEFAARDLGLKAEDFTLLTRTAKGDQPSVVVSETSRGSDAKRVLNNAKRRARTASKSNNEARQAKANDDVAEAQVAYEKAIDETSGDYLIGVDYKYKFDPNDNVNNIDLGVTWNLFDRIPSFSGLKGGSIQRHVLSPHDTLDPTLTISANVAVDKAIGLESILSRTSSEWSARVTHLPKERRELVDKLIREANAEGIEHSYVNLKASGATDEEISILQGWSEIQDTMYWLDNRDFAKSLRAQGYKNFVDTKSNTQIFAKPVPKNKVGDSIKYLDHETSEIKTIGREAIDEVYANGGTVARMKSAQVVGDDAAEFIISAEKQGSSYMRAVNDTDKVLNYRPGYYQVYYKDPQFVEKITTLKNGDEVKQVVATAGSIKDAELMASRLANTADPDAVVRYNVRGDLKGTERVTAMQDVSFAQGRSSQRVRGKRLQDGNSTIGNPSGSNILDPIESLSKSIRNISRRVNTREWLEASKNRFMSQYGGVLTEKDRFGNKIFPTDARTIGKPGVHADKLSADARTTWEYIRYMESGYANGIDDSYKAIFNAIGDTAGRLNLKSPNAVAAATEKLARGAAQGIPPSQMAKSTAFKLYLALNPIRQLLVQSHQAVRLLGVTPGYMASGKMGSDLMLLGNGMLDLKTNSNLLKAAGRTEEEVAEMTKAFRNSGLFASVDANNIVRGSRVKLADMTAWGRTRSALSSPIKVGQRLGFDAGEQVNIMTAWLSFRHQAVKAGKKLNAETYDEIAGLARNWTYNMNAAGDMPYNQNMLNTLMQFVQVPHKAFLANVTNRAIPKAVRARMLALDTIMWGTGGIGATMLGQYLPDEGPVRDVIIRGAEEFLLNKGLSTAFDEDVKIDFSSLAPGDLHGMAQLTHQMFTTDAGQIIAKSPSGQLFFGGNPRLTNWAKTTARFFNLVDDYEDPTEFSEVAHSFAKMASGYSNSFKALYMMQYGKKLNSAETKVVDPDVNSVEAVAQVFGLGTLTEAQQRSTSFELYTKSKAFREDVTQWYKDFNIAMSNRDLTAEEIRSTVQVTSEAWRVFEKTPEAMNIITKLLEKDLADGRGSLIKQSIKAGGFIEDKEEWRQTVLNSGLPKQDIDVILQFDADLENYGKEVR